MYWKKVNNMKNKKKLIMSLGIAAITMTPIIAVVSCGNNTKSMKKDEKAKKIILNLSNYKKYTSFDETTNSLTIKSGITEISDFCQSGFPDPGTVGKTLPIKKLILPSTLRIIDKNAFKSSKLTSLIIPNGTTSIGKWAFEDSILTSLIIPNSVTNIDTSAFFYSPLISLIMSNNIKNIGNSAFATAYLTSLIIPSSLTTVGDNSFYSIVNAATTTVTMPKKWEHNDDIKNTLFGSTHWNAITFTYE